MTSHKRGVPIYFGSVSKTISSSPIIVLDIYPKLFLINFKTISVVTKLYVGHFQVISPYKLQIPEYILCTSFLRTGIYFGSYMFYFFPKLEYILVPTIVSTGTDLLYQNNFNNIGGDVIIYHHFQDNISLMQ